MTFLLISLLLAVSASWSRAASNATTEIYSVNQAMGLLSGSDARCAHQASHSAPEVIQSTESPRLPISKATLDPRVPTEVLYSWQNLADIVEWAATDPQGRLFKSGYLYAWRTPAATFAYGDVPIRIKLKPNVEFVEITREERDCRKLDQSTSDRSVYIIDLGGYMDYLLCSQKVMDSWSFGTRETVEEIRKEVARNQAQPESADNYGSREPGCTDCPVGRVHDYPLNEWRMPALEKKLSLMEHLVDSGIPRVYCMNGHSSCHAEHFIRNRPSPYAVSTTLNRYGSAPLDIGAETAPIYIEDRFLDFTRKNAEKDRSEQARLEFQAVKLATEALSKKPLLEIHVISRKPPAAALNSLPAALRSRAQVLSPDRYRALAQRSTSALVAFTLSPGLETHRQSINFAAKAESDESLEIEPASALFFYLLRFEQARLVSKVAPTFAREHYFRHASQVSLTRATKLWGGIQFFEQRGSKCISRRISIETADFEEEKSETSMSRCKLFR